MSADLFNMIIEKPEVSAAHNEYETAISNLRAQVMTALDEGMFEEQEMWYLEWQKRLGVGVGHAAQGRPVLYSAHDTWKRWEAEAAIWRQEAEKQKVAVREVRECEEEQIREEERARATGSSKVGGGAEVDELAEQFQEAGKLEEDALAMVVSPVAMPTRKGKEGSPQISIAIPLHKHPHSEAFDKGSEGTWYSFSRKQGEEVEEEDDLAGDKVTEATACNKSRGNARQVMGDAIGRKGDRCTTCEEKKWAAKRDHEVSETSGASKVKGKGKGKAHLSELVLDTAGPSQIAGPACMAGGSNMMARLVDDIIEIESLKYKGVSGMPNETINAVLSLVGRLAAQSSSIDTQLQAAKARLRDANVEMRDAIKGQKRYREQLVALESQVTRLMQEARACPLEDTSALK
ncbi:hypothetical protein PAXRUDRAFT_18910 [Paxillus rubicundulus Ve08.2h10]|uniref:Unplaced genomic scaffold scaffold_3217, whole genome shotgun sequence n=1 Tax=Paxillus rubicundulus Ve08.2h10 TaxID=930991 RepID=A0A0D0BW35_9AGAM|nr:hypothetical protein PAXRUDRAFT_18910 [Paxillus rubicundulus Ve08.2h10]